MQYPTMIKNELGQVAISHYQPFAQLVKVNGREYNFAVKSRISLTWVEPEDVDTVLSITKKCGCGDKKQRYIFRYASLGQVRKWTTGRAR